MARILIAGGSLGGLMAGNALLRAGHDVCVLERVSGPMDGRGAGIVTHPALVDGLHRCGMDPATVLGVAVRKRITFDSQGLPLGELAMDQVLTSWSRLYHILHGLLPAACYRQGVQVRGVEQDGSGVKVSTDQGVLRGDLLVGADGIRSAVRAQLWPSVEASYAGYVGWRGVCDEAVLSQPTLDSLFPHFGFCLPPSEQIIGYPVAGPGNNMDVGRRAYNFVWYRPAPAGAALDALLTDADGVHYPQGISPNKVSWREVARMRSDARALLAPQFAEITEKTAHPFLQPIYDMASEVMVQGRVCLLGDSAFVARPHVGMGVTKAMDDAVALADAVQALGPTPEALQAYQQARLAPGRAVVERGRRLGAEMLAARDTDLATQAGLAETVMREVAIDLCAAGLASAPTRISGAGGAGVHTASMTA
jgi:2-polyprenyl-6-methoxyphenol hydroxylase-like FAD-dependent oxidoreductase